MSAIEPRPLPSELEEGSNDELPGPVTNRETNKYMRRVIESKLWYMVIEEDISSGELQAGDRIVGQFTPEDVRINIGANVPESGGYGRTHPIIQWVGGTLDEITFKARLFSDVKKDNTAEYKYNMLKLLMQAHQPMNRPPLVRFFWGSAISGGMSCFVSNLTASLDEVRNDGTQKGMSLDITLKKFTQFTIERSAESPMERTPIHVVKNGETYEMIAYRRYGDPLLGVSLRQQNPRYPMENWAPRGMSDLKEGETIKLYPVNDLRRVKPESHILSDDNQISLDNKRYYFTLRSYKIGTLPKK